MDINDWFFKKLEQLIADVNARLPKQVCSDCRSTNTHIEIDEFGDRLWVVCDDCGNPDHLEIEVDEAGNPLADKS